MVGARGFDPHSLAVNEAAPDFIIHRCPLAGSTQDSSGSLLHRPDLCSFRWRPNELLPDDLRGATMISIMNYQDRIIRDPQIVGGEPVFKGTRVTLRTVLASLAVGCESLPTFSARFVK